MLSRWFSLPFRLRLWRGKARYWRARAHQLERQLQAEMWRNRAREDELITVPMRTQGMFGMPPRERPAATLPPSNPVSTLTAVADPFNGLTPLELAEWEIWKADADENNIPIAQAKQEYLNTVTMRRAGAIVESPQLFS